MKAFQGAIVLALFGIVTFALAYVRPGAGPRRVYTTLGEVQAVHATLKLAGKEVRGIRRFSEGQAIETGPDGRGRARLDDGTSIVLDHETKLAATPKGVELVAGRIFVQGVQGARARITVAGADAFVGTSTMALDRGADGASVYCVSGEVVLNALGREQRLRSGETARMSGHDLTVAPEKAFNDWTGGMAHPWSAWGRPRASIGELWSRRPSGGVDGTEAPLAIRNHDVEVTISGETASTTVKTTYFNAGSTGVSGDFRMALPPGAIVAGFGVGTNDDDAKANGEVRLGADTGDTSAPKLEWAGDGWVRGTTATIEPGQTSIVIVRYVEWLSPTEGRMTYRYPMLAQGGAPVIGEFYAHIDADAVPATAIGVGADTIVAGGTIEIRRADFRPTADLVVDFDLRPGAFAGPRAYVAQAADGDAAGDFILVRSEASPGVPPRGVTLALLLDTSRSIDPALLDAERALAEAVVGGLGPQDRAVVLSADETAHPVGPPAVGPVDPARREEIRRALASLKPGGATDLGAALERAADVLPPDDPSATLLYVGDGWPTLGDAGAEEIRTRLGRRKGGAPRLAAVAVGPTANRFGLAALVRGGGPVFGIDDKADAAEIAVSLLAEAFKPSVADISVDLGPRVERVYPRGGRFVQLGETMATTGRLRGPAPDKVTIHYRAGADEKTEVVAVSRRVPSSRDDVRRRWALARVDELLLRGGGREAVVDAALKNELMTPWTGWAVGVAATEAFAARPLWARMLDAGLDGSLAVFSARFATPPSHLGTLTTPDDPPWPKVGTKGDAALENATLAAAARTLEDGLASVRQCDQSWARLRGPGNGVVHVTLKLDADGHPHDTVVGSDPGGTPEDAGFSRCVELVVQSLVFFPSGLSGLAVSYEFHLPPVRDLAARPCSPTSRLPSPVRRGVWYERLRRSEASEPFGEFGELAYTSAKRHCELADWSDRRTLLELLLEKTTAGPQRIRLATLLDEGGDGDAAAYVRRETVRRAQTPEELDAIRQALRDNEPDVSVPFVNDYDKAKANEDRLRIVERYLRLSPHDARLERRELALLEALHKNDELVRRALELPSDPFLNASLLADGASALLRAGRPDDARKTFGELVERAPSVPFSHAFLGDRLLDERLYDPATAAYEALLALLPEDPAASFRLALAHAGAGRLDVAARILARVAQTGGRTSDPVLQDLASLTSAVLVAEARASHPAAADEERLARRALETPLPDVGGIVLVRAPTWMPALRASMVRGTSKDPAKNEERPASSIAPSLGIAALRIERGDGAFRLRLGRQADLEPSRPAIARVSMLVLGDGSASPTLVTKEVVVPTDGSDIDVSWDGSRWL